MNHMLHMILTDLQWQAELADMDTARSHSSGNGWSVTEGWGRGREGLHVRIATTLVLMADEI